MERTGASVCSSCPAGQYQDILGASSCKTCNYHCEAGQQHTGCSGAAQGICVACVAGKHKAAAGVSKCELCAPGRFHAASGQTSCLSCVAGQYQESAGQHACIACNTHCAVGESHSGCGGQSAGSCKACSPGHYKSSSNALECTACPTGRFQAAYGAASCRACFPHTFENQEGSVACQACDYSCAGGQYHTTCGGPTAGQCASCAAGKYKPDGYGMECFNCEPGSFAAAEGSASCEFCDGITGWQNVAGAGGP